MTARERKGDVLKRRARTIPIMYLMFLTVTALLIPALLLALLVDLVRAAIRRKPFMAIRFVGYLWVYLFAEAAAVTFLGITWIASGAFLGLGKQLMVRWTYALQLAWARFLYHAVVVIFRLQIEIKNDEAAARGPIVVFFRHASIIDNLLPLVLVFGGHGVRLRYVLKKELLQDPALDVAGNRIPNHFADRTSKDSQAEIDAVRALADGLGERDGVLIYPEGTRYTPEKKARALEKMATGDPVAYAGAQRLRHTMPPRLGGPLALLEAGTDVVFCAHSGLDGFAQVGDLWDGKLIGATVEIQFWRVPAEEVPEDREGRVRWLYEQWQAVDDWIGARKAEA